MKNWKNDDDLLNLAFGELSDRDSQALEAKLLNDLSAQKELEMLRLIRSDMSSLRDIPEMQFSKERLREAILSQGAKPMKPATNWLSWLLPPAALASVAALAFVVTKGVNRPETTFVARNEPAIEKVLPPVEIKTPTKTEDRVANLESGNEQGAFPDVADTHWAYEPRVESSQRVAKVRKSSKRSSGSKRVRTRINSSVLVATNTQPRITTSMESVTTNPSASRTASVATDSALVGAAPATESAPIIIIDSTIDSGVGAPTATEVSNPSNVLIGG